MAIRDRIKAKFSKNKSSSNSPPDDTPIPGHYTGRTDIEYYKPHEIPKSKYRGQIDKVHKERLDSYCFEDAFSFGRRASTALSGTFSPGGTKAFSRRTSYVSNAGTQTPARSRRSSLSSDANDSFSIPSSGRTPAEPALVENAEDDTDIQNTGLSRVAFKHTLADNNTSVVRLDRQATVKDKGNDIANNHIEHSQPSHELPFTAEELTRAMTKATITPQITAQRTSVAVA